MKFVLDPTGHYTQHKISRGAILEAVGILPQFAAGPGNSPSKNMEENYQFFMGWSGVGDAYIEDECFMFPEDPALYPLMRIENGTDEVIYIYPHSIVADCTEGDLLKWTRMD